MLVLLHIWGVVLHIILFLIYLNRSKVKPLFIKECTSYMLLMVKRGYLFSNSFFKNILFRTINIKYSFLTHLSTVQYC